MIVKCTVEKTVAMNTPAKKVAVCVVTVRILMPPPLRRLCGCGKKGALVCEGAIAAVDFIGK